MSAKVPRVGSGRTVPVSLGAYLALCAVLGLLAADGANASQPELRPDARTSNPVAVAVAEVNALNRGQVDAAYALWTASMQEAFPLEYARLAFGGATIGIERLRIQAKLVAVDGDRARVGTHCYWAADSRPAKEKEGPVVCLEREPSGWRVASPVGLCAPIGWLSTAQQQVACAITDLAKRFYGAWAARDYKEMYAMLTEREQAETPRDTFVAWVSTVEPPGHLIYVSLRTDQLEKNAKYIFFTLYTTPSQKSRVDRWTLAAARTDSGWRVDRGRATAQ